MKELKEYLNLNEGWVGNEGDKAFDKILEVMESWKPEHLFGIIILLMNLRIFINGWNKMDILIKI